MATDMHVPVSRDGKSGYGLTTTKKDSPESPSPTSGGEPLTISFTMDELRYLEAKIERLTHYAIICRVVGTRQNRSKLKKLLYGKMMTEGSTIKDI